ncbi:MAG TPA: hypothetical protein VE569_04730 [Acidimicrobiia bacterium]|nr:hypothetical protein [Acidimicrobiia bacterium]
MRTPDDVPHGVVGEAEPAHRDVPEPAEDEELIDAYGQQVWAVTGFAPHRGISPIGLTHGGEDGGASPV